MEITEHPDHKGFFISHCGKVFIEKKQFRRSATSFGYLAVSVNGEKKMTHRLVAETYIPNPFDKPLVCHKDDNPSNNHVSNLWWGTHKENMDDMTKKKRDLHPKGLRQSTIEKFYKIKAYKEKGYTNRKIGEILGQSEGCISQDVTRMRKHGYYPKTKD